MTTLERLHKAYKDADLELAEAADVGCDDLIIRQYSRWLDDARAAYFTELNKFDPQPVIIYGNI
jgi:hypothetical protein